MKILSAALLLALTFDATLKAQITKPPPVDKMQTINPKAEIVSGSERVVRSAPFSAEAISESVQFLFDGNRITQSVKTRLYRDSEGRFRRDELPKPVGIGSFVDVPQMIFILDPVAGAKFYLYPETKTVRQLEFKIKKNDKQKRVEKAEWDLTRAEQEIAKTEQEIAQAEQEYEKLRQDFEKRRQQSGYQETGKDWLEIGRLKQQIENRKSRLETKRQQLNKRKRVLESQKTVTENWQIPEKKQTSTQTLNKSVTNESSNSNSDSNSDSSSNSSSVTENDKPAKVATESKAVKKETMSAPSKIASTPTPPNNPALPVLPKGEAKSESLGTRRIEGVEAEGVRQTTTVAAGAIGNERAIEIVYERWFSKELQLIVFSKYTDPRFGEQTYRLTNIKRDEPDSALFSPPADYRILTEPEKRITVPRKKPART